MNTITWHDTSPSEVESTTGRTSPVRRFFSVVAQPQSYRNIGYLLLGLPLGTIWFSVLISAVSVGLSMLVVALLGIPILLGTWYVIRALANVERGTANALLGGRLALPPVAAPNRGNLWVRLRELAVVVVPGAARPGDALRLVPLDERLGTRMRALDRGLARRQVVDPLTFKGGDSSDRRIPS